MLRSKKNKEKNITLRTKLKLRNVTKVSMLSYLNALCDSGGARGGLRGLQPPPLEASSPPSEEILVLVGGNLAQ